MNSSMDFTAKTEETLSAAVQLAKDYANSQGMSRFCSSGCGIKVNLRFAVQPVHIAFALLNDGAATQGAGNSLFTSVIQKAGGDPVS